MSDTDLYPNVSLKMYQVTFDMLHRHTKEKQLFTTAFPAVDETAAKNAVADFCWGINEATNHLYVTDANRQSIIVTEVEHVRVFAESVNDNS